jgi:hypothetical protein
LDQDGYFDWHQEKAARARRRTAFSATAGPALLRFRRIYGASLHKQQVDFLFDHPTKFFFKRDRIGKSPPA